MNGCKSHLKVEFGLSPVTPFSVVLDFGIRLCSNHRIGASERTNPAGPLKSARWSMGASAILSSPAGASNIIFSSTISGYLAANPAAIPPPIDKPTIMALSHQMCFIKDASCVVNSSVV